MAVFHVGFDEGIFAAASRIGNEKIGGKKAAEGPRDTEKKRHIPFLGNLGKAGNSSVISDRGTP
jgi:hypothetical protein